MPPRSLRLPQTGGLVGDPLKESILEGVHGGPGLGIHLGFWESDPVVEDLVDVHGVGFLALLPHLLVASFLHR